MMESVVYSGRSAVRPLSGNAHFSWRDTSVLDGDIARSDFNEPCRNIIHYLSENCWKGF